MVLPPRARFTITALYWMAVVGIILYLPGLFWSAGAITRAVVASGWLGAAAFGVGTGRYVLPKASKTVAPPLTLLAAIASVLFLAGMIGAVALVASLLANMPALLVPEDGVGPFDHYIAGVNGSNPLALTLLLIGSYVIYRIAGHLIDVNLFSLNAMYANRLTRCYVGASRPKRNWSVRWALPRDTRANAGAPSIGDATGEPEPPVRDPNPITGFDPRDDLDLRDLRIGADDAGADRRYWGPHLLINTTLNLVGDDQLDWRDRKGESFLLSSLYCGAKTVGYAKLDPTSPDRSVDPNLTLGRAISISGAAVDPNMSFYQSAPLTALLTIFNARLGYRIQKPKPKDWTAESPRFGKLLLTEFFGQTDGRGEFVHISDGGHFENLGVYELIRRRCRYIISLDSGEDGDPSNDNLAALIRLCRIDFGSASRSTPRP